MRNLLIIILLFSASSFSGAPALLQSQKEIQAILDSQKTAELLGNTESIEQIIRTKRGYLLMTQHKELLVDIHYLSNERAELMEFELIFHHVVDSE
jgi:hypothetical protein